MLAYVHAKKKLLDYMREHELKPGDRLPIETELSELLGISRLTLREAMNTLKSDGILHSVQGKGTFVACEYDLIADSLNTNYSVTEMIEVSGARPGVSYFEKELIKADETIAQKLGVQEGSDVLMCARIRTADDSPVVFTRDYLSPRLAQKFLGVSDEGVSIYSFIEQDCAIEIGVSVAEIIAVCADERCARLLNVEVGAPLLQLRATVNDAYGAPLVYAIEYFRPDKFKFIVTRGR